MQIFTAPSFQRHLFQDDAQKNFAAAQNFVRKIYWQKQNSMF